MSSEARAPHLGARVRARHPLLRGSPGARAPDSLFILLFAVLLGLAAGCAPRPRLPVSTLWVSGASAPVFDPDGPPHALRWTLERLLSRGLTDLDSTGEVVPGAARSWEVSADGLRWSFHLEPGLRFVDGTPCTSEDFRRAIEGGLARRDHSTRAWLLSALEGAGAVRAGRPLPELGIETPSVDALVVRLARPDSTLLEKLALPGVSAPWRARAPAAGWAQAVGLGPYRVRSEDPGRRLTLVRVAAPGAGTVDTIEARFGVSLARLRALLRAGTPDLVWPEPPGLSNQPLPAAYRVASSPAAPPRRLLLVLRADVPPASRLATRHALAHATNHEDLLETLGRRRTPTRVWIPGAAPFEFPRLDAGEAHDWMARGHLGRSFHVTLAFDAEGEAALVARVLQGQWARLGIYAELRELRGAAASSVPLEASPAQAMLVEAQAPSEGPAAELATLVMPYRGPAVGSFRTGFRTREFDRWIAPASPRGPSRPVPALDPDGAQRRLDQERIALPLADLPWIWIEKARGPSAGFTPRFGPDPSLRVTRGLESR